MLDFNETCVEPTEQWERQLRSVFVVSREDYRNVCDRNTYMGNRLNNLGMGPGPTAKTADQV